MTTIELEASKAELVREILNIENSETIGKLRKYLSKLRSNKEEASPCEYTLEEFVSDWLSLVRMLLPE